MVYDRAIPSSVKFREAYARGIPLIRYDRFSPGAEGYRAAARSFLERSGARADGVGDPVGAIAERTGPADEASWTEE